MGRASGDHGGCLAGPAVNGVPAVIPAEALVTEPYRTAAEFLAQHPLPPRRGRPPALTPAELLALALYAQLARFRSERAFWRDAEAALRPRFPALPARSRFNRGVRRRHDLLAAFAPWLAERPGLPAAAFEVLDTTLQPVRNARRRGRGWLAGLADRGRSRSRRLGWGSGGRVLVGVAPCGVVTGWGVAPASTGERAMAATLLGRRRAAAPRLAGAGRARTGVDAVDAGFAGADWQARCRAWGAALVAAPQKGSAAAGRWSAADRRWLAGRRQVVEGAIDRLPRAFRLEAARPHAVDGLLARRAAKVARHNWAIDHNRRHGRPLLALAELFPW